MAKSLVRLTIPMVFALLAIFLFGLIDAFYVGFLGVVPLAALSFTFPVVFFFISLSIGLGIGVAAVVSRYIGAKEHEEVYRLSLHTLCLALCLILFFASLGLLTIRPVFTLIGASGVILQWIEKYMVVWYLGVPLLFVSMSGNNLIRATGDMKTASKIMLTATLVNALLDPLFIFGFFHFPRLELVGAAVASVIAWCVALIISLWVLIRKKKLIRRESLTLSGILYSWRQILTIGIPAMATNIMIPISAGILTWMLSAFGPEAVAAFGVGSRLQSVVMVVAFALTAVLNPFVGQNMGAQKVDRVKQGVFYSLGFVLTWQASLYLFLALLAPYIALVFSKNGKVIWYITLFIWVLPASYGFQGLNMIAAAAFNGLLKPIHSTSISLIRLALFYLPLAYLGGQIYNVPGVFIGMALGNVASGTVAALWVSHSLKELPHKTYFKNNC